MTQRSKTGLCIVLFSACACTTGICGKIVYPWRSATAVVKPGEAFEVWFDADSAQTVPSVELQGPYHAVSCTRSVTAGDWEYDPLSGNRYDTRITVTVPVGTPADRYDLVLHTSSGNEVSHGGVKVVSEFKPEYYIMHISDGHLYQSGYDPELLLARKTAMIEIADIMDVQLIIETGDNMYNVRNHPEREVIYFQGDDNLGIKGMADARAATFLIPGDHDAYTANDWLQATVQVNSDFFNDYWGLQSHSFRYGNGRFMLFNNAWNVSTSSANEHGYEINDAVAWLGGAGSGGNFFLTAGHCYDKMHEFIDAVEPLDLVLAGDKHHERTGNPWPFDTGSPEVAYIAGAIRDHFEFNLYKISNSAGTFTTPPGPTAVAQVLYSGDQNTPSSWVPNMEISYTEANNGTVSDNTATIINRYGFPIEGARIRFIMPLGQSYGVSAGVIVQAFDGDSVRVVDVNVDLDADSTTIVGIYAAGTASNLAAFVSWNVPTEMDPGETAAVQVAMKNIGLNSWTLLAGQKLGSQNPADNTKWGLSRVDLPGTVETNQNAVFTFNITAPATPGVYDLQWQMIDDAGENTGWFGSKTPSASIQVGSIAPDVNFISPAGNVFLTEGDDLYVNVGATDSDGILRVWLYKDGVELARSEGGYPYEWGAEGQTDPELQNLQEGRFVLTAKAKDLNNNEGWTTQSITVTVGPPPENLVLNPSFEVPNSGWTFIATETTTAANYTGSSALRLNALSDQARQTIPITPGTTYNFSFRVNTEGLTAQKFVADTQDVYDGTCQFVISAAESGWQLYGGSFEATTPTVTLRFFTSGVFTGIVYVDDVSLTAEYVPTPYDIWASINSVTGTQTDDDDHDGRANLLEYALNGNPTIALDLGVDPILENSGGQLRYIHMQRNDDPDLAYSVQTCTNLAYGAWTDSGYAAIGTNITSGAYDEVTISIPTVLDQAFIRLKVER